MKLKKIFNKIICIICCLSTFVSLLLASVFIRCYDINFYGTCFNKYELSDYTGLNSEDYHDGMTVLLDYLQDKRDDIDIQVDVFGEYGDLFNSREIGHMIDVKNLALICYHMMIVMIIITIICLIILIFNLPIFTILKRTMIQIYSVIALFLVFLSMSVLSNFDAFWTQFHHVFFPNNDLWLLNPATDNMIRMLPGEVFNDLVLQIIVLFVVSFIIFNLALLFIVKKKECHHD